MVLGRKRWALAVCLVQAAGHCPCRVPLSGMPLGIVVVVVGVHCRCHRRTVRCCYRTMPAVVSPCLPAVPLAVVARRCRCRHALSLSLLCRRLAAPRAPRHCAPSLHCRAVVTPLDPLSSSPSVVVTAPSPSSRCRASLPWCHWAPSSHHLRIAGPAAIAVRHCRALYPPRCTPLPSHCVRLRRCAVVRCRRCRARCACLARLASVLWRGAWAVGLSMGWWRGRRWGPLRVVCMAVFVVVRRRRCRQFIVARPHKAGTALFCTMLGLFLADGGGVVCPRHPRWQSWWWRHGIVAVGWSRRTCGWQSTLQACAQCQGLWAWWTVVWGGAIGAVRSSSPQWRRVVVAVGGLQCTCGWRSMSRACAQCQGLWARWTVVWGDALGAV